MHLANPITFSGDGTANICVQWGARPLWYYHPKCGRLRQQLLLESEQRGGSYHFNGEQLSHGPINCL
jgi:hypothetical protein